MKVKAWIARTMPYTGGTLRANTVLKTTEMNIGRRITVSGAKWSRVVSTPFITSIMFGYLRESLYNMTYSNVADIQRLIPDLSMHEARHLELRSQAATA